MYGFTITKGVTHSEHSSRKIEYNGYLCENNMIRKFENDKLFAENGKYIVILDGVVLNKDELQTEDWLKSLIRLYEEKGEIFCSYLNGTFAGALYDKSKGTWIIFTDHIGQKFIYYTIEKGWFICSSYIDEIYSILKENNIKYNLDENGAKFLLSYGFMLGNYTLCDIIKKIQPGCYIVYDGNTIIEKQYFRLENKPNKLSYQENIDKLDELFCLAVRKEYQKDAEYGYSHICSLSGGLDCRMTSFIANEIGYKKQLNVTFSQSDYWDEVVPKQISRDLHHDWIFKTLDNGMFLFDIDDAIRRTGGHDRYYATAMTNSLYKYINFDNLGIFHTGQLGDVTLASKCKSVTEKYKIGDGACSTTLLNEVSNIADFQVENKEIGLFYFRYLNGTNNGIQNIYNYTEFASPFCELEFLKFCLSIPLEYRYDHRIYKDWICSKHPGAANYVWESIGTYIGEPTIKYRGAHIPKSMLVVLLKRKIKKCFGWKVYDEPSMNPIDKYIKENDDLRAFLEKYKRYVSKINDKKLQQHVMLLMDSEYVYDKIMAVTLLAAVKAYF